MASKILTTRSGDNGPHLALRAAELDLEQLRAALQISAVAFILVDGSRQALLEANAAACELFGRSRPELLALAPEVLFDDAQRRPDRLPKAGSEVGALTHEAWVRRPDGSAIPVEIQQRATVVGDTRLIVLTMHDISPRRRAAEALQRQGFRHGLLARFGQLALEGPPIDELAVEAAAIARDGLGVELCRLLQATADDRVLFQVAGSGWDEEWSRSSLFDAVAETEDRFALGAREVIVVTDFQRELRFRPSPILAAHGVRSAVEVLVCGAGGSYGVLGAYARQPGCFDAASADFMQSIATTMAAAIERHAAEERLVHMAQFDALTGLPNRGLYLDRLGQTLIDAERDQRPVGVLFVDIDRFKTINDTLGHAVGDALLEKIAARLQASVRAGDTVGRMGGDEFTITLSHLARDDDAAMVARKIVSALAEPYRLGEHTVYVSASVGIGLYPTDGKEPDTLLKNADTAMYRVKESGRNGYEFFLPKMNERALARMRLESDLRGALDRNEYLLHYQPKVRLATGEISGMEALLRWAPHGRDTVSPGEFIPVLEDTGLIVPVGLWVVNSVCAQLRRWQDDGVPLRPVAINLSARQFRQGDLDAAIGDILATHGVAPELLELELTESTLMSDSEAAVQLLGRMKARGMRLTVDDFGTGYSSLAYLKRFPLDALKIDRTFISDVTTDSDDATIAKAMINLAHSLKLVVVAEGVETEAQLAFLREHACDEMQGFLYARPLPVAEITRRLLAM